MTTTISTRALVNNGVNVTALLGARESLQEAPEAAQFKWRATCEWLNGTHSRSAIGDFFGLGAEQSRNKTFTVEADHPQVFAAEDKAPTLPCHWRRVERDRHRSQTCRTIQPGHEHSPADPRWPPAPRGAAGPQCVTSKCSPR